MDNMISIILSLLAAIGIGGILGAYFQSRFQHKKELEKDLHELKRKRYGAILIQMLTVLDPERGMEKIKEFRPDLKNMDDVKAELKTEMLNAVLFANDEVMKAMSEFSKNPTYENYLKSVVGMRRELWGRKTKVGEDIIGELTKRKP